jgi:hypothetical protein
MTQACVKYQSNGNGNETLDLKEKERDPTSLRLPTAVPSPISIHNMYHAT